MSNIESYNENQGNGIFSNLASTAPAISKKATELGVTKLAERAGTKAIETQVKSLEKKQVKQQLMQLL